MLLDGRDEGKSGSDSHQNFLARSFGVKKEISGQEERPELLG